MKSLSQAIHLNAGPPLVALVGNPNCGKTALFNFLTGSRQKVANYAGVTVERKEGALLTPAGKRIRLLDLPGTYGLSPRSPDEQVTTQVLDGTARDEPQPGLVICVLDATNLRRGLRLALQVRNLGLPIVIALNMADIARQRGIPIDAEQLAKRLGVPVVSTVAITGSGIDLLLNTLDQTQTWQHPLPTEQENTLNPHGDQPIVTDQALVNDILDDLGISNAYPHPLTDQIDDIVLHPLWGPLLLTMFLFLMFQAVFVGAEWPMAMIELGITGLGTMVSHLLPQGLLQSLLVDGILAGVGGVLAFLPQILILYAFILLMEESGYMPRAAFLLDRMMGRAGLSGRSFIPLLSSFACAVPGIMATRTIANRRDRLVTILIAPLMTCSARLPVYTLLIAAFIPSHKLWGVFNLQGLVLFALYCIGILIAFFIAWVLKHLTARRQARTLMMELPAYHMPRMRSVLIGLWHRADIFLKRMGTVILLMTIVLWAISSFPPPPTEATEPAIRYSLAGMIGHWLEPLFAPIGFNWQISVALIPGMAAREMMVSALSTVYALSGNGDQVALLAPMIAHAWGIPTGLSLLAWFIFAPQCISTLITARRETNGWMTPALMVCYLFTLAYAASFLTYQISLYLFQ